MLWMVSRYAKDYCLFTYILMSLALVTRTGNQPDDGPRLKTAAHLAASGDLRETVEKIWLSDGSRLDERSFKVWFYSGFVNFGIE